ncbi:MAG: peptidylprolyl isomerase [Bryobacteraceae bacterium]|nr:peptidylprolyl isomerase [Bryobacteraceae bacterium]
MGLLINGEFVDEQVIRDEAASIRPRYLEAVTGMDPVAAEMQLWDWSKENVIERTLLRQVALADPDPIPESEIEEAMTAVLPPPGGPENCEPGVTRAGVDREELHKEVEARLRIDRMIARLQAKVAAPRHKDLVERYKKNRDALVRPAMALASHIVRNVRRAEHGDGESSDEALAVIQAAEQQLEAGIPFADVANQHSSCAGNGGALGWFPMGEMVEEFDEVVFALKPGERSKIFRSQFGYHIALLHERREPGPIPFDEVKAHLEEEILKEKRDKALHQFLDALRAKAKVTVTEKAAEV